MKYDVIVVLAGGITNQQTLPESVKKRILLAKKLYSKKLSSKILMSGKWSTYWDKLPPTHTEAELMKQYAIKIGIPKTAIFLEEYSQNTFENVLYVSKLFLEPKKWEKVLVITSDFHVQRAKIIFNKNVSKQYNIDFLGSHGNEKGIKKLQLQIKEFLLSNTQWFFQYLINRH